MRDKHPHSDLECSGKFFRYRYFLEHDISGQAVAVWRIAFALDQRSQVLTAFRGDAEAIPANKAGGHLFLFVCDFFEVGHPDRPSVGPV